MPMFVIDASHDVWRLVLKLKSHVEYGVEITQKENRPIGKIIFFELIL